MEKVKLTIDGQEVVAPKGELLIEVCEMQGIYLPRFCHFRGLTPQASCRMCVVRVEKMPKLQTACTMPVAEGMVVTTSSQEVEDTRAAMIEFLLSNHPVDCPVCDRAGECELQDQTFGFGEDRTRSQFDDKEPTLERQISPFIYNDPQRCVTCKRCTRVCEEWMDEFAITTINRGSHTLISSFGGWVECSDCGNCVDVCPTGTLLHVPYKYVARPWDLKQTSTICNFCSDGCSILAGTRSEELVRGVARDGRGRTAGGINHDFLCSLGRYTVDMVHSPERIDRPLVRRGDVLVPTTWDDALSYAAKALANISASAGSQALGVISGRRLLNEDLYTLAKFAADVLATANRDSFSDDDEIDLKAFLKNGTPTLATQAHLQSAETILLIGSDPNEENPLTAFSVRWAVRQGSSRLFIVNSMPSRLERQAELALRVREGSEPAVVAALLDADATSGAAEAMGVSASDLDKIRRVIAESDRVVVVFGDELSGPALEALPLLERTLATKDAEAAAAARRTHLDTLARQVRSTNSTNKPAINENPLTAIVPHPTLEVASEPVRTATKFSFLPLVRYSNSLGSAQMGMTPGEDGLSAAAILAAAGSQIKGLYVAGEDPLAKAIPGEGDLEEKLRSLDVLIVQDMFMTETARLAHVVFPSTSFAESQGTQVNNGGQVQMVRRVIPPVGQARPDWMITNSIARLMGHDLGFQGQVKQIFKEIADRVPGYAGLSHNRLVNEGAQQITSASVQISPGEGDRIMRVLRESLASIDRQVPVIDGQVTFKAGSKLRTRYPLMTRYSKMFSPDGIAEEKGTPIVFPA
jgi:NADH-quinone oxidoreductase subunit G